jgi:hypothetical protein
LRQEVLDKLPASVIGKFRWAECHDEALKNAIRRYAETADGKIWADTTANPAAIFAPPLPEEIALIAGDCIQNMRSCLDYLAGELCIASGNNPTDFTEFPVCKTIKAFRSKPVERKVAGISMPILAEIDRLQPYHAGNDYVRQNLWILHELCNINKHRRIILTCLTANDNSFRPYGSRRDPNTQGTPADPVNMERQVVADVLLKEGIVDDRLLAFTDIMLTFVEKGILARFAQFF